MTWFIGTSGWMYPHWQGPFYPRDLPAAQWLAYYAQHFDAVELNRSFYRWPTEPQFAAWREAVPQGFHFAVKASRALTHLHKLSDPGQAAAQVVQAIHGLGPALSAVLFQLPPRWHVNVDRLRALLAALPRGTRYAFEFRDPTWHTAAVREVLEQANAAFCVFDLGGVTSPRWITADFVYVRLHGPHAPYRGRYGQDRLEHWASWLMGCGVADAHVYFDNDEAGHAVEDARLMRALLGARA